MPPIAANLAFVHPLWIGLAVTVAFSTLARVLRGVSTSGAVAGGIVCYALYAGVGVGAFGGLVSVFVLTWAATRFRYAQKAKRGVAEKKGGRSASQVLANVGLAGVGAVLYHYTRDNPAFLVGLFAVLAEAAADTVSSELGQASSRTARLVTNWKPVPAGTDGGVTIIGTVAGAAAAALIAAQSALTGLLSWRGALLSCLAAVLAMFVDSFLGAMLERRGFLNNDAVNFLGTLFAATLAITWP